MKIYNSNKIYNKTSNKIFNKIFNILFKKINDYIDFHNI